MEDVTRPTMIWNGEGEGLPLRGLKPLGARSAMPNFLKRLKSPQDVQMTRMIEKIE